MKPILITGATGFLGQHLVRQLKQTERGRTLRLLCRGSSPWDQDAGIEVVRGDITSREDVRRAVEGTGEIYHLAGFVARNPKNVRQLYEVHIEGTRNICEAMLQHKIEKTVVVSSSGTIAVSPQPVAHNEESGYKHDTIGEWPYYLSKLFAEKLALRYREEYGLPIVVANPSLMLGPGDERNSSTGDVVNFLEGQFLAIPKGGMNFVDARDAAAGLIAAMRRGKPGERYLLGGENWTFRELIHQVGKMTGVRPPKLQPSLGFSLASARLLRKLFPLVGKSFRMDDATIKMSALYWYCDTRKAQTELGFKARDAVLTLKETVEDVQLRLKSQVRSQARKN